MEEVKEEVQKETSGIKKEKEEPTTERKFLDLDVNDLGLSMNEDKNVEVFET